MAVGGVVEMFASRLGMTRYVFGFNNPVVGRSATELISDTSTPKCRATACNQSPDWELYTIDELGVPSTAVVVGMIVGIGRSVGVA